MTAAVNTINWFEIPATDITRAMKFYSKVLDMKLETMEFQGMKMCVLAHSSDGVSGALVVGQDCTPSDKGTVVYLNGGDDLSIPLARVVAAGGKVVLPKTSIGEHGFCAHFIDTEGNKVAFHSMK
jgi:predicted enzyme related to lactoylglutathione lyase